MKKITKKILIGGMALAFLIVGTFYLATPPHSISQRIGIKALGAPYPSTTPIKQETESGVVGSVVWYGRPPVGDPIPLLVDSSGALTLSN